MLESRLKIKHGYKQRISLNHILNCSITNQGCDGGYSYLVSKFGHDLELLPESCESTTKCEKKCKDPADQKKSIKVKNYKFVGGSYGKSNEEMMMRDIKENGPAVCSFTPGYAFSMYKNGIYNSISKKSWKMLGLSKPQWVKVEHSVLCVGWGN